MPTIKFDLSDAAWVHLGNGNMEIHPIGSNVIVATGDAPPTGMAGLPFEAGLRKRIETSQGVFARSYMPSGICTAAGDGVGAALIVIPVVPLTIKRDAIKLAVGQSITIADLKLIFQNQITSIEASRESDSSFVKFTDFNGDVDENYQDRMQRDSTQPHFDDALKWEASGGAIVLNVMGW